MCFQEILDRQIALHEHSPLARPATLVAGVFNRPLDSVPELTRAPDWTKYRVIVGDEELQPDSGKTLESYRRLDIQRGVFEHDWRVRDRAGRITHLHFVRFVSLADRHALVESLTLVPENYSGRVSVDSVIDGTEANAPVEGQLWRFESACEKVTPVTAPAAAASLDETFLLLVVHPPGADTVVAFASSCMPRVDEGTNVSRTVQIDSRSVWERWTWDAVIDTVYRVEKRSAVYSSRDGSCPKRLAIEHLGRLLRRGAYEPRTAAIDVILGRERVGHTQIIKQPSVILLMYQLWDQFPREVRETNFRFYAPRCAQVSSLSPSIHALVAARLGDLANNLGNAAGGVHAGAMGGLWQSVVFGVAGMRAGEAGLAFDPRVFRSWRTLAFPVQWRNRRLRVVATAEPRTIDVVLEHGEPVVVQLGDGSGPNVVMELGKRYRAEADNGDWRIWTEVAL